MTATEAAAERQAHILGMIDQLTGEIGAYLAQFADEDQAGALPLAMMRLQGKMRQTWNEFRKDEYIREVWEVKP